MNTKRFAALVLAAALAVCSVSGCTFGEKTRIAATYSGGEVPAGVYIAHQLTALNEAYYKVPDMSKNVLEQEIDGAKAADWINNRAAELTRTFVAVESEFDRLGLTLDPETAAAATQGLRSPGKAKATAWKRRASAIPRSKRSTSTPPNPSLFFRPTMARAGNLPSAKRITALSMRKITAAS